MTPEQLVPTLETCRALKENLEYFENLSMDFDINGLSKDNVVVKIEKLQSIITKAEGMQ